MKRIFSFFLLLILCGCGKDSKVASEIESLDFPVTWLRFDQDFVNTSDAQFHTLKEKYPFLLPENVSDTVWFNKRQDSLFQVVSDEVKKSFSDVTSTQEQVNSVLKHIHYFFPEQKTNKVLTLISDVDADNKVIYTDSLVIIGLDNYLGADHRFYTVFPDYARQDFEAKRIPVDVAQNFAIRKVPPTQDRTFLGQIIYYGKVMEVVQQLVPDASPELILNCTSEKYKWAEANELEVWKYFMDNKYLYDTNPKLFLRFIQKSPFSKFYLEFDHETPGSIGIFIGWNIVKSYMKNNNVTLQQLLIKDSKEIFDNAKYKPKK